MKLICSEITYEIDSDIISLVLIETHYTEMSAFGMPSIFLFSKMLNKDFASSSLNIADYSMGSVKFLSMLECHFY